MTANDEKPKLYALFDGDEIDERRYALGDEIRQDLHDTGTLAFLQGRGRIGGTKPVSSALDTSVSIDAMSRAELLNELADGKSNDELREALTAKREYDTERARWNGEGREDGEKVPAILDQSIDKLTADLEGISDAAELQKLRATEAAASKPRSGALAAIDARISALNA